MKRYTFATLILTTILISLLTACSGGLAKMDFSGLKNENGDFVLSNASWGASVTDTQKAFGNKLENPVISDERRELYSIAGDVKWEGITGATRYEFIHGEFTALEYFFTNNNENNDKDLSVLFDSIYEKVKGQYGEPSGTIDSIANEQFYWDNENEGKRTALYLIKNVLAEKVTSVTFVVTGPEPLG